MGGYWIDDGLFYNRVRQQCSMFFLPSFWNTGCVHTVFTANIISRDVQGGLDQNPPVVKNFGNPPSRRRKFLGFFREFSGKFRVF